MDIEMLKLSAGHLQLKPTWDSWDKDGSQFHQPPQAAFVE